jgi:hypothetical protein
VAISHSILTLETNGAPRPLLRRRSIAAVRSSGPNRIPMDSGIPHSSMGQVCETGEICDPVLPPGPASNGPSREYGTMEACTADGDEASHPSPGEEPLDRDLLPKTCGAPPRRGAAPGGGPAGRRRVPTGMEAGCAAGGRPGAALRPGGVSATGFRAG